VKASDTIRFGSCEQDGDPANGPDKDSDGACCWWLRSPGVAFSSVTVITGIGAVFTNGYSSGHIPNPAVRPVMRIDLSTGR